MIITTTDQIEGKRIVEVKGLVQGNTVRARNVGRDIIANFRNIIGGEIVGYTNLMTEARSQASERMEAQAEELGANALVRHAPCHVDGARRSVRNCWRTARR